MRGRDIIRAGLVIWIMAGGTAIYAYIVGKAYIGIVSCFTMMMAGLAIRDGLKMELEAKK